jgi:integrase
MRGTIQHRPTKTDNNVFRLMIRDKSGKQLNKTVRCKKREAEKMLNEWVMEIQGNQHIDRNRLTVEMLFDQWVDQNQLDGLAYNTISTRRTLGNHILPIIGYLKIQDITKKDIQKLILTMQKESGLKASSINKLIKDVNSMFKFAVAEGKIGSNPAKGVKKLNEGEAEMLIWTAQEFDRFHKAVSVNRKFGPKSSELIPPLFLTLFLTGMRLGEGLAITEKDIDFHKRTLRVNKSLHREKGSGMVEGPTKTKTSRTIALSNRAVECLKRSIIRKKEMQMAAKYWNDNPYIFVSSTGKPFAHPNLAPIFDRHIQELGLPRITIHGLRHTFASTMIQQGLNPLIISKQLGHSQVSVTLDTYSHLFENDLHLAADKMDRYLDNAGVL